MSNVGVHSFQIPHEHVQPTRDMVIVRIPLPPSKIGSILTPDITRDMMQHNVMAGRIVAMGPLAFQYRKGENDFASHSAKIGDWVLFRPFAGTMIQGGQLMATNGYRYVSSFNDVIGIISAEDWNPTCEWEYKADEDGVASFGFHNVKEKVA
jgi:co-chaperonin GroES (HSP10)